MNSLKLRSRVGADGVFNLKVPVGVTNAEVEVVVVFQLVEHAQAPKTAEERGWPAGFFEQTAGSIPDCFEFDHYERLDPSLDDDFVSLPLDDRARK